MRTSASHNLRHVEPVCDELVQQTQYAGGSQLEEIYSHFNMEDESSGERKNPHLRHIILRILEPVEPIELV